MHQEEEVDQEVAVHQEAVALQEEEETSQVLQEVEPALITKAQLIPAAILLSQSINVWLKSRTAGSKTNKLKEVISDLNVIRPIS